LDLIPRTALAVRGIAQLLPVMVAVAARTAVTAGRSVTAGLGLRENAGCDSQHQKEAQQGRL